jgi:hypothetical protein
VIFFEDERVIWKPLLGQEHSDQTLVGLILLADCALPLLLLLGEETEDDLPAVLPHHRCLVRDPFCQMQFEFADIYDFLIENIHETTDLLGNHMGHPLSTKQELLS